MDPFGDPREGSALLGLKASPVVSVSSRSRYAVPADHVLSVSKSNRRDRKLRLPPLSSGGKPPVGGGPASPSVLSLPPLVDAVMSPIAVAHPLLDPRSPRLRPDTPPVTRPPAKPALLGLVPTPPQSRRPTGALAGRPRSRCSADTSCASASGADCLGDVTVSEPSTPLSVLSVVCDDADSAFRTYALGTEPVGVHTSRLEDGRHVDAASLVTSTGEDSLPHGNSFRLVSGRQSEEPEPAPLTRLPSVFRFDDDS